MGGQHGRGLDPVRARKLRVSRSPASPTSRFARVASPARSTCCCFPTSTPRSSPAANPTRDSPSSSFWSPLPPAYSGGIDDWSTDRDAENSKDSKTTKGGTRIKEWVENGGTVVALGSSSDYFIELFELPVSNSLAKVSRDEFNCPGSTLRVSMNTESPLTFGMRPEEAIYFADSPAYQTRVPDARFGRTVIARYPDDDKDILIERLPRRRRAARKKGRCGGVSGRKRQGHPDRLPRPTPCPTATDLQALVQYAVQAGS